MALHVRTDELVAANLTNREAILASVIAEVHTLVEKAQKRPAHDPDGSIADELAASILMMTAPVLDLVLGRKQHHPGDRSRIELIAKLSRLQVPVMPSYPNERDLDEHSDYTSKVESLVHEHIEAVDMALPIKNKKGKGDWAASYRWAEDVAENGYDQRGR